MNEFLRRILFLPRQASSMSREIDYLHYSVILVTMAGAALVALAAGYFMVRYRRRPGAPRFASPPPSRPAARAMQSWFELSVVGFLLVLFVGWWVVGFKQFAALEAPPPSAMAIYVTAKQWMWTFVYPNGRSSNAVLYVPAHQPVQLLLSSRDVIHSLFVPDFRVKKDVIPGRMTSLWFEATEPGVYPIFCTEYCGDGHSKMRAEVIVLSEQDYMARLQDLPRLDIGGPSYTEPAGVDAAEAGLLSLASMGERVAVMKGCMRCHTADGTPHIGPSWFGLYNSQIPLASGEVVAGDEAYMTESMMDPKARVHLGYKSVMPAYQGLLSAAEVAAIVEYIRYLSTRDAETRLSPLVPRGSPAVLLPDTAPSELETGEVLTPIGGVLPPGPDGTPYPPVGEAAGVEALP